MDPVQVAIGNRLTLTVTTVRDEESMTLVLDVETPWGIVRTTVGAADETLRGILNWLRAAYGNRLYSYVTERMAGYEALAKIGARR